MSVILVMATPEIDCIDCTQGGKAELARQILELLQEDNK